MGLAEEEQEEIRAQGMSVMERGRLFLDVLKDRDSKSKVFHTAENMMYFAEDTGECLQCASVLLGAASKIGWIYNKTKVTTRTLSSELADYVDSDGVFSVGDFEYIPKGWEWTDEGFQHIEEEDEGPCFTICDYAGDTLEMLGKRMKTIPQVGDPKKLPHYLWGTFLVLALTALCTFHPGISSFLFAQREPAGWIMVVSVLISFVVGTYYGFAGCLTVLLVLAAVCYFGVLRRIIFLLLAVFAVFLLISSYCEEKTLLKNKNAAEERIEYLRAIEQDAKRIFDFSNRVIQNMNRMCKEELYQVDEYSSQEQYRRRHMIWYVEKYIEKMRANRTEAMNILRETEKERKATKEN